jgi:hypothetical protein
MARKRKKRTGEGRWPRFVDDGISKLIAQSFSGAIDCSAMLDTTIFLNRTADSF